MKNVIKSIVAALAVVVGFNSWAASSTFTAKAVPSDGGGVWTTQSPLAAPDDDDYESENSSTYDPMVYIGSSHTFYGYYKENGEGDFLYWSNSETGTSADYELKTQTIFSKTYVYMECSVGKNASKTVYAHFHKHTMAYEASGLTINGACSNTDGHCKSHPTTSATLTAADTKEYDGQAYVATTDNAAATITYAAKEGSALTEGQAVKVGEYTVTMTFGDKTVSKDFTITHQHSPVYSASGNVISMSCAIPGCAYQTTPPTATLTAADATYTASAYAGATVTKDAGFIGEPTLSYSKDGVAIDGVPSEAGSYTVTATIGDAEASATFTIAPAQMSGITATMATTEFDYTASTIANQFGGASLGGYNLTADDFEISGVLSAMGSGYSNETYTVTLSGKGNFTGTKTVTWTIKAPTGAFASSAKADGVGGTYEGTTLTIADGADYVYANGVWAAGITAEYPEAETLDFFKPEHAIFSLNGEMFKGGDLPKNGVLAEIGQGMIYKYMKTFTYWTVFTPSQLEAAAGQDLTRTLTACALVWSDKQGFVTYGDDEGIKATDFTVIAKTAGITLPLPANETCNIGATVLSNVRIQLGEGAAVTTTAEQTEGQIFTTAVGCDVLRSEEGGVYTYTSVAHQHTWQYGKGEGAYTASCSREGCSAAAMVKIDGAPEKTYDGEALTLSLDGKDNFEALTGLTVSDLAYSAKSGSALTEGQPVNAGSYQASFMVNGVTVARDLTISPANIANAETELTESFTYDFTEKFNRLGTVTLGDLTLNADVDYACTKSSQFSGVGNGKTDETFTIVMTGNGNFTGTKTLTWTIKAPETTLDDNSATAGGELVGTTLWMTNDSNYGWTYYTAEDAPDGSGIAGFYAGIKVAWPNSTTRWTDLDHAFFKANGATAWTNAAEKIDGVVVDAPGFLSLFDYIKTVTWWQRLTVEDLRAAEGETLTQTFSAIGLAWGKDIGLTWYGDEKGVKETDFAITTKLDGLELYDNEGWKVWPEHVHEWVWTVGDAGNVLTAACTEAGCHYHAIPLALSIAPTTVAEKYCDTTPLTATVTGGDELAAVTGAAVSEVEYFDEEGNEAEAILPGDYTAQCTVVSADETATNTIAIALRILTGQAIWNGVHVADAATYLEKKTQDAMEIYVGKDFTASKTFVIPASWKAETPSEYDMTIRQFIEAVRDGEFGDLYTWSDVLDLIAGRTTIQELFKRLKDIKEEYTLLDCGAKTLDLNGFTVTAAEGLPLIHNLGTLTLRGEGVMTNACDILLFNEGTLSIEGGTYYGSITNEGALVVSGGYFTGAIFNVGGTVVLTGGAYEIKPDKDWVPCGYDLVRRSGIYYVEKHEHAYTFLPLGKCLMSCTCWNWFVDDPDQVIQFSNCNAHKVGVFIGTRDSNIGVLPQRTYAYTGEPVEANVVGYNYWAIARIGVLKNIKELVDIAEEAIEAENNWGEMTTLEQVQKMVNLLASIEDLDIDLTDLVWNQSTVEAETGLKFGAITYTDVATGETLEGAPVEVGTYRASVVITTPKGNEVTRSWKFAIGTDYKSDIEDWLDDADDAIRSAYENHKTNADTLVLSWRDAITNDFSRFCQQVKEETDNWPTSDDVKEFFDALDQKHANFFKELKEKGEDIDQKIIDAHDDMVKKLREAKLAVEKWTDDADEKIRAAYENHKTNADALVLSWRDAITNDFSRFCQQVKEETDNWPTGDDVKEFFDALDQKHANFFKELKEKGEDIDQKIIDAHDDMVKKLRELDDTHRKFFEELIEKFTKKEPSVEEGQGAIKSDPDADNTYIVEPSEGTDQVDISNLPDDSTVKLPPSIDTVTGVNDEDQIKIVADATNETGTVEVDITSAFDITRDDDGNVSIELKNDPEAKVAIKIGDKEPEDVPIVPELSTAEGTEVAATPFVVSEDSVATGVKTVPGLLYSLLSGDTPDGITNVVKTIEAKDTRTVLEAAKTEDPSKFYRIEVGK